MKAHGSTVEGHWKLGNLSAEEE
ncbi:Hypothetical protein TFLO_1844, partial [Trichococcus flocculiformis]